MVVKVNNINCRVLLDTGAGSLYASSSLLQKLNIQPVRKETKLIETMMCSTVRTIGVFEAEIKDPKGSVKFKSEVSKIEREALLSLPYSTTKQF